MSRGAGRRARRVSPATLAALLGGAWLSVACAVPGPSAGSGLSDLPLVEVPARRPGTTLALLLSGDGGWAPLDREVALTLADSGVAVIGLDARQYLEHERTPDRVAADVRRILERYTQHWQRRRLVIVGYSRGADIAPFALSRLPDSLRRQVALVALLGLAPAANFQFHLEDLVRDVPRASDHPIAPELERLRGMPLLCIYGAGEVRSGCRGADATLIRQVERPGGHHFDGNYRALALIILAALR